MKVWLLVSVAVLLIATPLAVITYVYGAWINTALQSPIADRILLIILTVVDGIGGVLVPFFIYKAEQREKLREKLENKPVLSIEYDEKGEPDTFAPTLQLIKPDGTPTGIFQKYLRVRVRNSGGGVARCCKAELRVTKWDKVAKHPSLDSKQLIWSGPSLEKDIGARNGKELLHVVFSDSRFETASEDNSIYALVSTMWSLYPQAPFIRAQDGFGAGDFEVELTVTSEDGSFVKSTSKIHVAKRFMELSMEKLS